MLKLIYYSCCIKLVSWKFFIIDFILSKYIVWHFDITLICLNVIRVILRIVVFRDVYMYIFSICDFKNYYIVFIILFFVLPSHFCSYWRKLSPFYITMVFFFVVSRVERWGMADKRNGKEKRESIERLVNSCLACLPSLNR